MKSLSYVLRSAALAASLAACGHGPGPSDAGDGGDGTMCMARVRNDFINVNCVSAAGNEGAADCNQRLSNMAMGATFFVGGRADCAPDPYAACCQPLCPLTDINPTMCTFDPATGPGCAYSLSEGYVIVVQTADGRRATAAVGGDGNCAAPGTALHHYANVGFDDLLGAVGCAGSMPDGGFGPARFGTCDTPMAACGDADAGVSDTCMSLMFMGTAAYMANVCTHTCMSDGDCNGRGTCSNGFCFARCGGACNSALPCDTNFGCSAGSCLPNPP